MARGRFPSDEARLKIGAHVKVFLAVSSHPRYGQAWSDPETRGIIIGLWLQAGAAFAAKSGDVLFLPSSHVTWITGREKLRAGLIVLARACRAFDYPILFHLRGERQRGWREALAELQRISSEVAAEPQPVPSGAVAASVHVRNFAIKQGFASARRGVTPRTPHPSECRTPKTEHRLVSTRSDGDEPAETIAARFSAEAVAALPDPWCQQLVADRPDLEASVADFRAWLRSRLPAMRERGYRSLRRTAASWWTRAARLEVVAAIERELLVSARAEARASPPRPAAPMATGLPLSIFEN